VFTKAIYNGRNAFAALWQCQLPCLFKWLFYASSLYISLQFCDPVSLCHRNKSIKWDIFLFCISNPRLIYEWRTLSVHAVSVPADLLYEKSVTELLFVGTGMHMSQVLGIGRRGYLTWAWHSSEFEKFLIVNAVLAGSLLTSKVICLLTLRIQVEN
jgi:hypothetical protein